MIAATIGRTFLKAYNEKHKKELTAKQFFEEEYFKYFFNHPKYLQWITNSPFVQMKAGQKPHLLTDDERKEKLENLNTKIANGEMDASIAIGFPASEMKEFATTSGLVSDIKLEFEKEDIYYSWIGGGLGIGIAGGYSIFFNHEDILLKLFEGWKVYRGFLNDASLKSLRGNQINTWNGQWLNYSHNNFFQEDFDFSTLHNNKFFSVDEKTIEVNTVNWSQLFFNLSNYYSDQTITGYIYSLGQTNKTLGFYPFHFEKAQTLRRFYKQLFGEQAAIQQAKDYEVLFGIHIKRACELGSFGLQAMEPKDLRKYYGDSKNLKLIKPKVIPKSGESEDGFQERKTKAQKKDYENIIYYQTYKTWLLAMITKNKEESLEYTREVAKALQEYRKRATKTDRVNLIQNDLLVAKSKKVFIDALVKIVEDTKLDIAKHELEDSILEIYKDLRDRVHMMNVEEFGYFVVLLKFDFAFAERENN
nr:hypothetical protein [Bacteroidota bacterium]